MKFRILFFHICAICITCLMGLSVSAFSIKTTNTYINTDTRTSTIKNILFSDSLFFDYSRLKVLIDGFQREPRGRMKNATVYLSPYVLRDSEFVKLFIHELAHFIDIYLLAPRVGSIDPSQIFYHISWQSPTVKRS